MFIDATIRFACHHEFIGLPLDGRPEYFRCHKCAFSKPIEVVIPGPVGVATFDRPEREAWPHRSAAPTVVRVLPVAG